VVGGWENDITLVDNTRTQHISSTPQNDWITTVSCGPNLIASSGWGETIFVYQPNPLRHSYSLIGHTNVVTSCAFSHDGKYLVSSSFDSTVKLWNLKNKSVMNNIVGHRGKVNAVTFGTKSDNYIISGGEDRFVKFWDMNSGNLVNEFVCQGPISTVHCTEKQQQLVMVAGDKIGNLYLTSLVQQGY